MTASIQPPALAWAWRIAVGDPGAEAGIRRQHEWLAANRDLDGDGLLWIVQPDESGLDASNQFDPIWRHEAHGLPGFVLLVHRNRRLGYDLRRIAAAGGPVCLEVVTNVLYILSRLALGLPVPPPSVAATEPGFSLRDTGLIGQRRYWRGPTWVNAAWLVWIGLHRLGYEQRADELARRLGATVAVAGLREYYEPYTGGGMGAVDFGWSSLILELLDPDPQASRSYV